MGLSVAKIREIAKKNPIALVEDTLLGVADGDQSSSMTVCANHLDQDFMARLDRGDHLDFDKYPF